MTPRRLFIIALLVLTAVRLFVIAQAELCADEAYYHMWSERPDISYYSKGPGVAATMWLSTHIFGHHEFGIRFFSPLLSLGTSLLMFLLARRLYGESVGIWTALMINTVPIFNAGSLLMTIDPLSIFFWVAALYTFWRALELSPRFSLWWPGTGALIGLGFLCKYTNAMELLSVLLLLVVTRKYRGELARPGFYAMLGAFLPFLLPPIIWNASHEWITLAHLSARGGLQKAFHLDFKEFFEFFFQHFGAYSPLVFAGMLAGLFWAFPLARRQFKSRFLLAFTLPLWVLYLVLALKQGGEANWTAPAMISLGILSTAIWHEKVTYSLNKRRFAVAALALGLFMSVLVVETDMARQLGIPWSYKKDPSQRLRGWRTSAEQLSALRAEWEAKLGQPVFLISETYQTAANLGFYLPDKRVEGPGHPPIYVPESQNIENQFSFWPSYDELVDLRVVAADLVKAGATEPEQQERLNKVQTALAALPEPRATGPEADRLWQDFVRSMLLAAPNLPIDEFASREGGISFFQGRSAIYITDRPRDLPRTAIKSGFERVEMIACWDQTRRGLPMRRWRVFLCRNYRGMMP